MFIPVQRHNSGPILEVWKIQEPLVIDRAGECHVTPADVAARMVDYLGRPGAFNTLEPNAGTGALVSA
ncbi:MAG: methyltransferase type 11, partial [Hyphomonas sp.]